MQKRPCENCGRPTAFTAGGCPACPNSRCGQAVLAQLEADSRELAGMPFLAAAASLDEDFASVLMSPPPDGFEQFALCNMDTDASLAALLE